MARFFRNKTEILLWFVALAIFGLLVVFVVYGVNYIINQFNAINDPNLLKAVEIVKFNLEKVNELRK